MLVYIRNNFIFESSKEANGFVLKVIDLGEVYIKFLVSKNKIYLPDNIKPRDAAIDLLAEIFKVENKCYVNFKMFFKDKKIETEEDAENLLRGYIFTIIQNELPKIFRINDSFTYNILRNIKEAIKSENLHTSLFFSDKYIHLEDVIKNNDLIPDKDELLKFIYENNISDKVYNIKLFLKDLLLKLSSDAVFSAVVNFNDLVYSIKSIFANEFACRDGAETESEHLSDKVSIKLILKDIRFSFNEKLNKYINKNGFSNNFSECMYKVIDDIESDLCEGLIRQSVKNLSNKHFGNCEFLNQITYCVEMYETEIAKFLTKEKFLIDRE